MPAIQHLTFRIQHNYYLIEGNSKRFHQQYVPAAAVAKCFMWIIGKHRYNKYS